MKCIRNLKTNEVTRVTDSIADNAVDSGSHVYVPKSIWKSEVRDVGKAKNKGK